MSATPTSTQGPKSNIPDKLYFKIGEVAQLVGVQPHVLRYWEKEVPSIRPGKSASNQRRYRRRDVEAFREIRRLLYEERYTLAGARKRLGQGECDRTAVPAANADGEAQPDAEATPTPEVRSVPAAVSAAEDVLPGQMPLGFRTVDSTEKLDAVRTGLRDLIRLSGEEP
jgi:DNA-binding transcriptional MerR regulator